MKRFRIKNGFFALLIFEALIISLLTVVFMIKLYNIYTDLVYSESAEVLNLYARLVDSKLEDIEGMSFEMLSNRDIQRNLLLYTASDSSYDKYIAADRLYTQLFTHWAMDKSLISISFVFSDGKRVDTGLRRVIDLSGGLDDIVREAERADGSCGWMANVAGSNTVTLYRLIKDISGNGFRPLGVLIINLDAKYLLDHTSVVPQKYKPDIIGVAGDQMLSQNPVNIDREELLGFLESSNTYDIVAHEGEQYFVSVKSFNYNRWQLIYLLSCRDILSSINNMNLIYMITLAGIVFAVVTVGYALANAISRPIARLTDNMKVIESGDYSVAADILTPETCFAIEEVVRLSEDFTGMINKIDHLINEGYVKQLTIMEMKYKMLQQQINPHFLYNTLDTINWKAIQNGNSDISVMIRSLSSMLRGSINGRDVISLGEDLRFVEDYITIQGMRFEERLSFEVDIPEEVYHCPIPRLTLQPIVENCIIHNLEKYSGICRVRIASSVSGERLEITVEDNGRGADLKYVEMVLSGRIDAANSSIGLKNINERLKLSFGGDFGIRVENREPTGTRVTVVLPFEEDDHENIIDS